MAESAEAKDYTAVSPDHEDEGFDSPSVSRTSSSFQLRSPDSSHSPGSPDSSHSPDSPDSSHSPGSPDSQPVERSISAASDEGIGEEPGGADGGRDTTEAQALRLVDRVIRLATGAEDNSSAADPVHSALRHSCNQMKMKHGEVLPQLVQRLCGAGGDRCAVFRGVADELFEGEKRAVTWHRIVALFCFAEELLGYCQEHGLAAQEREEIGRYIGSYVVANVVPYVRRQGGWAALSEQFPASADGPSASSSSSSTSTLSSSSLWSVLKWGVVGLGVATASRFLNN